MSENIPDTDPRPEFSEIRTDADTDLLERTQPGDSLEAYLERAAHNDTDYAGIYSDIEHATKFENRGGWEDTP